MSNIASHTTVKRHLSRSNHFLILLCMCVCIGRSVSYHWSNQCQHVAVKKISPKRGGFNNAQLKTIYMEILFLHHLSHQNIVRLKGVRHTHTRNCTTISTRLGVYLFHTFRDDITESSYHLNLMLCVDFFFYLLLFHFF